jgi:hypothetical protein
MVPPGEELLSDKDLREASTEQLINLRDRMALELQRRSEQEGIAVPPQQRPKVPEAPDPADPTERRGPGESPQDPALD